MNRPAAAALCVVTGVALVVPAATAADPVPTDALAAPSVRVTGTLLAIPAEPDSGRTSTSYVVRLGDGDLVPVETAFDAPPASGSGFSGTLEVPEPVWDLLDARGVDLAAGETVGARSRVGRQVLGLVDASSASMTVAEATTTAPAVAAAPTTTRHRLFVALPTNLGSTASTDQQLLGELDEVADYWDDESDGAVDVEAEPTIKQYDTEVPGAVGDCGLGDRAEQTFPDMVDEAELLFPTYVEGRDHLVILAPENGCSGRGFALGIGFVGTGLDSASAVIATADSDYVVGTTAHELGHNYGLLHANVSCRASCSEPVLEYAGIYDVMGYGIEDVNPLPVLSTAYRVTEGVTAAGEIDRLAPGTAATTRTRVINARQDEAGLRSLAVTDPADGTVYYLDYRSGAGEDQDTAYAVGRSGARGYVFAPGVVVTRAYEESADGGGDGLAGGVVVVPEGTRTSSTQGQTWTSPSGGVRVSVGQVVSGTASVTVSLDGRAAGTTVAPPTLTSSAPTIAGATRVGSRLTAVPGTWTPGTSFDHQWLVGGAVASTAATFTPPASARGRSLQLVVTGRRDGYTATSRRSAVSTVGYGVLSSVRPRVTGVARVGRTLRVVRGRWTPGTTLSQAWTVGGRVVSRRPTLRLRPALQGTRVSVRVTGQRAGYLPATRTSGSTRVR